MKLTELLTGKDTQTIVPLTSTVSVPATIKDKNRVLIDIGTGYFVKKTTTEAKTFYERRIQYVKKNMSKIEEAVQTKTIQLRGSLTFYLRERG